MFEQAEIDALLASAADPVTETGGDAETHAEAAAEPSPAPTFAAPSVPFRKRQVSPRRRSELDRILKIRVPVIVTLADRSMALKDVLRLTSGSILEFDRPSDADLDLVVANRVIGTGQAVKVRENFGLRVTSIGEVEDRIKALGGG